MSRPVHLLGEGGRSACCGKSMATLGLGAILTDDEDSVTCAHFEPRRLPEKPEHVHNYDGECVVGCRAHGEPYRVVEDNFEVEEPLRLREGDQPLPQRNDAEDVQSALIREIEGRRQLGIQRYGTALQPFNGRDSLRDLLDELLDGATYALQVKIERDALLSELMALQAERAQLLEELSLLRSRDG